MDIHSWLFNPKATYADGISIYSTIKKNKKKDSYFSQVTDPPQDSLHFQLLRKEIFNHFRITNSESPSTKTLPEKPGKPITAKSLNSDISQGNKPRFVHNEIVDVKSLPENIQKLFFDNQKMTKKLAGLHQELRQVSTDLRRKVIAEQISALFENRIANWKIIDAFAPGLLDEPSHDKPIEAPTPQSILSAKRRLDTVKINLARSEKELSSLILTPAKIKNRKTSISRWKEEIRELESIINNL